MKKAKARKILDEIINNGIFKYSLPVYDEVLINGTRKNKKGNVEFYQYTFRGLIKLAYDLEDKAK